MPALVVPEIRDYARINAEVVQQLESGHQRVRLVGVEGHRLLLWGVRGPWRATIDVEGRAGPELAAEMDAPGLIVVCHGSAADGAGRRLRAGRIVLEEDAAEAVGYGMAGGVVLVAGSAGHRAGLATSGGTLVIGGSVGRLAGEKQSGGRIFLLGSSVGPSFGHGRRGGRLIAADALSSALREDAASLAEAVRGFEDLFPRMGR